VPIGDILRNNVRRSLSATSGGVDDGAAGAQHRIARIARRRLRYPTSTWSIRRLARGLRAICIAALEAGIAPFVRVPANTPDYVARAGRGRSASSPARAFGGHGKEV
jgi:hypothetical protein